MMKKRCKLLVFISLLLILGIGAPSCISADSQLLGQLQDQLQSSSGLPRRQAARKLLELGPEATATVLILLGDADTVIRRNAYRSLRQRLDFEAIPFYKKGLQDESPLVRMVIVEELMAYQPRSQELMALLRQAAGDPDNEVRKLAAGAFWSFHRDYLPIRKRPNWDHAIEILQRQALPLDTWLFRPDPGRIGHMEEWFAPQLDTSSWYASVIGKWWHQALPEKVGHFEGVAWYRLEFTAPTAPNEEFNEAVLHFAAVDESTWVWVNGHYAGEHDLGTSGWDAPFDIEVGSFLRWGEKNQLSIRVLNASGAGGIYKPVELQILK